MPAQEYIAPLLCIFFSVSPGPDLFLSMASLLPVGTASESKPVT